MSMIFDGYQRASALFIAVVLLFTMSITAGGAEKKPRILLAKHLSLNLDDIKIEGKITLFSLSPLTGELDIKHADGDPRRIFDLISESTGLLHGLSTKLPIKQLKLEDCKINLGKRGVTFKFKSAVIPEGRLLDVSGEFTQSKLWAIRSGLLHLEAFPFPGYRWVLDRILLQPFPLGFSSLAANGTDKNGMISLENLFARGVDVDKVKVWSEQLAKKKFDISLESERLQIAKPETIPDITGLLAKIMAYAGESAIQNDKLVFEKMMMRGVADSERVFINPVRLQAPELQVWGTIQGQHRHEGNEFEVKLTAKRVGHEEKTFSWQKARTPAKGNNK